MHIHALQTMWSLPQCSCLWMAPKKRWSELFNICSRPTLYHPLSILFLQWLYSEIDNHCKNISFSWVLFLTGDSNMVLEHILVNFSYRAAGYVVWLIWVFVMYSQAVLPQHNKPQTHTPSPTLIWEVIELKQFTRILLNESMRSPPSIIIIDNNTVTIKKCSLICHNLMNS